MIRGRKTKQLPRAMLKEQQASHNPQDRQSAWGPSSEVHSASPSKFAVVTRTRIAPYAIGGKVPKSISVGPCRPIPVSSHSTEAQQERQKPPSLKMLIGREGAHAF